MADANGIVSIPPASAEWVLQQVADLKQRHARIQPVLERGEVTSIDTITEALVKQGFVIDGRSSV